jgi:hypothetical protein
MLFTFIFFIFLDRLRLTINLNFAFRTLIFIFLIHIIYNLFLDFNFFYLLSIIDILLGNWWYLLRFFICRCFFLLLFYLLRVLLGCLIFIPRPKCHLLSILLSFWRWLYLLLFLSITLFLFFLTRWWWYALVNCSFKSLWVFKLSRTGIEWAYSLKLLNLILRNFLYFL